MNRRLFATLAMLCLIGTASTSADDIKVGADIDGIQIETPPAKPTAKDTSKPAPSGASCRVQCNTANARCGSEVRRARQTCSRDAATMGRGAFDSPQSDYGAFCAYFQRPRQCGPGCELRFARHYRSCMDAMNNTASMRQDCFLQERQATNICRDELRECEQTCQ
jgi:hypothetical protein